MEINKSRFLKDLLIWNSDHRLEVYRLRFKVDTQLSFRLFLTPICPKASHSVGIEAIKQQGICGIQFSAANKYLCILIGRRAIDIIFELKQWSQFMKKLLEARSSSAH